MKTSHQNITTNNPITASTRSIFYIAIEDDIAAAEEKLSRNNIAEKSALLHDEKNPSGFTALHAALFKNFSEMTELLLKDLSSQQITDLLAVQGTDSSDIAGQNAIHIAARYNRVDALEKIFAKLEPEQIVALLSAQNANGETPVHIASRYGNNVMVGKLLEKLSFERKGDILNIKDFDGYSALHAAAAQNRITVVNILIQNGARASDETTGGLKAADIAYQNEHKWLARDLQAKIKTEAGKEGGYNKYASAIEKIAYRVQKIGTSPETVVSRSSQLSTLFTTSSARNL